MKVVPFLCVIVVSFLLFAYPEVASRLLGKKPVKKSLWVYVACALYVVSWWLPSPLIYGQDMSSTTHFVGGGMFCGALWLDLRERFNLKWHWFTHAVVLFALVSTLGVVNELFELVAVEAGIIHIPLNDTNWDLLANTLGALFIYLIMLPTLLRNPVAKKR